MTRRRSPFAWIEGRPHLVINFDLDPATLPPLPELLARLLQHRAAEEVLLLRPLTAAEKVLLRRATAERDHEAWAEIVATEEKRYRGR